MRLKRKTGLWLLFCAALSSGCAKRPPSVEFVRPTVPATLRDCPPRPSPPAPEATQRDAALYLIALAEAHGLCRDRLQRVAALAAPDPKREDQK